MKKNLAWAKFENLSSEAFAEQCSDIIGLLLKDHEEMRKLMAKIESHRSSTTLIKRKFKALRLLVTSHMAAEETGLINYLKQHPKFEDEARESYEEHRIHEHIFLGIAKLKETERILSQMKIYCEMLEHHLKEEEKDLFPAYKKYFYLSSRKKAGAKFFKKRVETARGKKKLGALA